MSEAKGILLIDDAPSICDALSIVLNDHGYKVEVALNGRDGVELAGTKQFSVVITDLRLPDISGLDVLRHVKIMKPDCPVIIITAHITPELIVEAKSLGAIEVLAKPFFPSDILSLIETVSTADDIEEPVG